MSQETLEKKFTVSSPARLKLGNISGSVDIQAGEEGVISIVAVKQLKSGSADHTEIEITQAPDGTVQVETHYREGWHIFWQRPCHVDYTVRVPQACHLRVSGVSNTANISGVQGDIDINTVSGDLTLEALSGVIRLNAVSGDTRGEQISGTLRLETVSGEVRLAGCQFSEIKGTTVSGDLEIQTSIEAGPYRFSSVSGNVMLTIPPDTRCSAELSTISGKVTSSLPLTSYRRNGSHLAEVQGGGTKVRLNSVSGDLRLTCPDGDVPQPLEAVLSHSHAPRENPEAAPAETLTTAEILGRIERGELTAAQGLDLLKNS